MIDNRKCGKCKHFKPLKNYSDIGHCDLDDDVMIYTEVEKCSFKIGYGFEPKDGEQE